MLKFFRTGHHIKRFDRLPLLVKPRSPLNFAPTRSTQSKVFLENNFSDRFHQNSDIVLACGYIVDGSIDVDKLNHAFKSVIQHFPILSAKVDSSGKYLFLSTEGIKNVSWTVIDHTKRISEAFTFPPTASDRILVSSIDPQARMDFYFPKGIHVSRKEVAGQERLLFNVCIQRFSDKTIIGLAWNHLLTDFGGMSTVISSWVKIFRGEDPLIAAPYNDVFKDHFPSNPTAPEGSIIPTFSRIAQYSFRSVTDIVKYGPLELRTIFIPNSIIKEWKANSSNVTTNDLLTAWLFKAWASTVSSNSLTVSISVIMDLRKHLPCVVPETYLRNASFGCLSPGTFTCGEINKMSQLELAQTIRSIIKRYTPKVILNEIAYARKHCREGLCMFPKGDTVLICSSGSIFNQIEIDSGAKTELFEFMVLFRRKIPNVGSIWIEPGGARLNLYMHKKRWNQGIWKGLSKEES